MNKIELELNKFPGREEELESIIRYHRYKVMYYRTNLWLHSHRVFWLIQEILPFAQKTFGDKIDITKIKILALIHDDPEMVTGDYMAGDKSKMSKEELDYLYREEKEAIETLAKRFPKKIGQYSYQELLEDLWRDESLEEQLIMLADKLDAFGETLHEIFAGNKCFVTNIVNEYGKIPTPIDYYTNYLTKIVSKYPKITPVFKNDFWAFKPPVIKDFQKICKVGKPHTLSYLTAQTGYLHYDEWKKVLIANGGNSEIKELTIKRES